MIMKLRLSITQTLMGVILLMVSLITMIVVFVIRPSLHEILALKKEANRTQQFLETQYRKAKQLRRSIQELGQAYVRAQEFQRATIQPGKELAVITELERLAETYHIEQTLHVQFTNPQDKKTDAGAKKYGIQPYYTFSFLNHGTFADHVQYIKAIESLPYYVLIPSLQWEKRRLNPGEQSQTTLRFDADILVTQPL